MGDEQLIDLVKNYSAIYDIKCNEYRDSTLRNAAWEEIARLHGKPVEECKDNWTKLRSCYNNAMKRRLKKNGRADQITTPWRYEEQMSFLKPSITGLLKLETFDATLSNESSSLPSPENIRYAESPTSFKSDPSRSSSPIPNASHKRKASGGFLTIHTKGDEHLIDLVKRYSAIYNIKCKEYRDANLRNAAWEEIAGLHGKPVWVSQRQKEQNRRRTISQKLEECKENWNKLRNCYNNAMKRRHRKSDKIIAPWRFEKQMSFLKPFLQGRLMTESFDATISNETFPVPSPDIVLYDESPTSPKSIPSRTSSPIPNVSHKRRASSSSDNYLDNMIEMLKCQEKRQKIQEMDDLDTFFLSMGKMVKKLPKLDQIRIKMDLCKAVSEAELKQLKSEQNL